MSLIHTFSSACDLAHRMPCLVGDFIDLETSLGRKFREDTLSDLFIAALLRLPSNDVVVRTPCERRTGSDFDLALVDLAGNTSFQYRIQAKRLSPAKSTWRASSFRQLAHKNGTGSQAKVLCDPKNLVGSPPTTPLYAFYTPSSVAGPAGVPSVALANALDIEVIINDALAQSPRPLFKRLTKLRHLFLPLSTILCPSAGSAHRGIANPRESRDAYERETRERRPQMDQKTEPRPIPDVMNGVPKVLREALARREDRRLQPAKIPRPQVIIDAAER